MNKAAEIYLDLLGAMDFPEQEPAYESARNQDLLWLLFPIVGCLIFVASIESRYQKEKVRC